MGLMGQQHVKTDHNLLENLEAFVVLCVDIDPTKLGFFFLSYQGPCLFSLLFKFAHFERTYGNLPVPQITL